MKLKGKISISRDSRDVIRIQIRDILSTETFVTVEMNLAEFAMAITGVSHQPMEFDVKKLDSVGLQKITEKRSIVGPNTYDRNDLSKWLVDNAKEDGWTIDPYLGSQYSIGHKDGKTILHYSVFKYVAPEEKKTK